MTFLDGFLIRSILAGLGVAIAAAPLGCFIVWRRMALFGDATAYAAILGVSISLSFSISIFVGVFSMALIMALIISALSNKRYASDTLLGVMAHSALAFGLVIASFLSGIRVDLMAYLVGDILAVGKWDLLIIWLGSLFVVSLISYRWSPLILSTLDNDLARASGINPEKERLALVLMLAIVVAVAIKVVGALLIVAMLLIPTAAARVFSNSPEKMSLLAGLIGSISVILGLLASYHLNTPAGPSIVCLAAILFIISTIIGLLQKQKSL